MSAIRSLTVGRAEEAMLSWWQGLPRPLIDLAHLERFDAYGVALLALVAWEARERGGFLRILLPKREEVARGLAATGLFQLFPGGVGGLAPLKGFPLPLFPRDRRRERLLETLDRIRDRYGEEAMIPTSVLECKILVGATGGMGRQKAIASELFKSRLISCTGTAEIFP